MLFLLLFFFCCCCCCFLLVFFVVFFFFFLGGFVFVFFRVIFVVVLFGFFLCCCCCCRRYNVMFYNNNIIIYFTYWHYIWDTQGGHVGIVCANNVYHTAMAMFVRNLHDSPLTDCLVQAAVAHACHGHRYRQRTWHYNLALNFPGSGT